MKLIDKKNSRQNKIACNKIVVTTQEKQGIEIHNNNNNN